MHALADAIAAFVRDTLPPLEAAITREREALEQAAARAVQLARAAGLAEPLVPTQIGLAALTPGASPGAMAVAIQFLEAAGRVRHQVEHGHLPRASAAAAPAAPAG